MSLDTSFLAFPIWAFFITKKRTRNIQIYVSCGVTSWYCYRQVCSNSAFIIFIATRNDTQVDRMKFRGENCSHESDCASFVKSLLSFPLSMKRLPSGTSSESAQKFRTSQIDTHKGDASLYIRIAFQFAVCVSQAWGSGKPFIILWSVVVQCLNTLMDELMNCFHKFLLNW